MEEEEEQVITWNEQELRQMRSASVHDHHGAQCGGKGACLAGNSTKEEVAYM